MQHGIDNEVSVVLSYKYKSWEFLIEIIKCTSN